MFKLNHSLHFFAISRPMVVYVKHTITFKKIIASELLFLIQFHGYNEIHFLQTTSDVTLSVESQ